MIFDAIECTTLDFHLNLLDSSWSCMWCIHRVIGFQGSEALLISHHFCLYLTPFGDGACGRMPHLDCQLLVKVVAGVAWIVKGAWEQPPRGAPWVSGLVAHFVQTWPDSEYSHTVQFLDCSYWIEVAIIITCFGTVWPFWCWCAVKLWYHHHAWIVHASIWVAESDEQAGNDDAGTGNHQLVS